ncbi:chitobiase/beta-hexosaminidase C-terminal domain-containing protein [Paenibacillus spongiae]|uniref:Chitobiase/beta-hexosaminidase C-terminal domain-containing protein n=1 Tax=Paenibacillus spongiae TaxID=2909671 RepID=A0ABY5SE94_9BACL|nr:chitobiase/beta-hexosaminidase C-terminal domain-containing protein [Paenibacillus spongiae]UVI32104.1 chitobiase/beta-hexosaminidase C-terminal domain-containing protein [Paenibacillus spongiae]
MSYETKKLKRDASKVIVPQYWNPALDNGNGDWEVLTGSDGAYKAQSVQYVSADYLEGTGNFNKVFDEDMHGLSILNNGDKLMRFTTNGVSRPVPAGGTYNQIFKQTFRELSISATGEWFIDVLQQYGAAAVVVVPPDPDLEAPDNVTNLRQSNVTHNSATIIWDASVSTDTVGYEIWRSGALLSTVTGTTYDATGMPPETQFTFTVKVVDGAGNVSSGVSITVTTATQPAETTPADVTGLTESNVTTTSATITWIASVSSDIKDYRVYDETNLLATVTTTTLNLTDLQPETSYNLKVKARDTSNNESTGISITIKTKAVGDTTPPVVTASPVGGSYTSSQSITLTSNEQATIYYTTNGNDPTESDVYSTPIPISVNTTLKFFGKDEAGNKSAVQTATYTIDTGSSGQVIVSDSFNRANGALGNTETGQAWIQTQTINAPTISNNQFASLVSGSIYSLVDLEQSNNIAIEMDLIIPTLPIGGTISGIAFRYGTNNATYIWGAKGGSVGFINLGTGVTAAPADVSFPFVAGQTYRFKVELRGSEVKCYVDDVLKHTYTDSVHIGNTKHGIVFYSTNVPRADNFKITKL